jgi:Sulfotransferase domain
MARFALESLVMPKNEPERIAMWSGPRNISTAMMRAWGNRPDTFVCDEPFYACYLEATGRDHPGAAEVISSGETDSRKMIAQLTGPIPGGKRIFYQKQMTHHLLPEIDRGWLGAVTNCFLIRDPAEVIVSYIKKNNDPTHR